MNSNQQPWWKGAKGEWYVILQFVIFGLIFAAPFIFEPGNPWPAPWTLIARAAGLILGVIGGILIFAGLISLGSNLAAVPHPKDDANLVITGAFRIVRHPIYSGIILGSVGWGLIMNSWLALALAFFLFLFFDLKSRREEKWLAKKFDDYQVYQKRVRKLVPFLY